MNRRGQAWLIIVVLGVAAFFGLLGGLAFTGAIKKIPVWGWILFGLFMLWMMQRR